MRTYILSKKGNAIPQSVDMWMQLWLQPHMSLFLVSHVRLERSYKCSLHLQWTIKFSLACLYQHGCPRRVSDLSITSSDTSANACICKHMQISRDFF